MRLLLPILIVAFLAGCGGREDDGIVDIAFIADGEQLVANGMRLSFAQQHVRAATSEGLVSLDADGAVVPAIAERWIVTDDGASYIFRLRNSEWPDGDPITGENVRDQLLRNVRNLRGTSLGLDLAKIRDIRAMTGRVVEIRLNSPMPDFLQLLAQPELGLRQHGGGTGPMGIVEGAEGEPLALKALPPEQRGLPRRENWEEEFKLLRLRAMSVRQATDAFASGEIEVVLGGRLANLPLANTGALSRGTVRLEAALGLFGLQVVTSRGFLADAANREALSLAVNRETLLEPFNIGGWKATTRIVAPDLPGDSKLVKERWSDLSFVNRQAVARQRVNAWKRANGSETLRLAVDIPQGPGSVTLLRQLAAMYAQVGITLERAQQGGRADLRLKDRAARYGAARWFLNQQNCGLTDDFCSPQADRLVAEADRASDLTLRDELLAEAERLLMQENYFIPFGAPIRWSLVRADVDGFRENAWGIHPLFPLAGGTI